MKLTSLPIYIKDQEYKEPGDMCYYLLSASGLHLVKNFPTYRASVKVESGPKWLEQQEEGVKLNVPKIPAQLISQVVAFFYFIYVWHRNEAIVILFYDPAQKRYRIGVPPQTIEGKRAGRFWRRAYEVQYQAMPTPKNYVRIGTIHSHACMSACYSWTDEKDSRFDDSLNIVIGDVDTHKPSFYVCFMVNGRKFSMPPLEVMEEYKGTVFPFPRKWLEQVKII